MCPEYLVDLSSYCTPGEPGKGYKGHSGYISECGHDEVGHAELRLRVPCKRPGFCPFYMISIFPVAQHESCEYDSPYSMNSRVRPVFLVGWISGMERGFFP